METKLCCLIKAEDVIQNVQLILSLLQLSCLQSSFVSCMLFNLSLQVIYWALTSAKGKEASLHRTMLQLSVVAVSLLVPQALINLIKSFSD